METAGERKGGQGGGVGRRGGGGGGGGKSITYSNMISSVSYVLRSTKLDLFDVSAARRGVHRNARNL